MNGLPAWMTFESEVDKSQFMGGDVAAIRHRSSATHRLVKITENVVLVWIRIQA